MWTQASRSTHFLWFPVPASSSVPMLLFLLHISWWTFFLAIFVCIGVAVLRSKGRTAAWVFRRIKGKIGGGVMYSRPLWYRRRRQSFVSYDLLDLKQVRGE